jgi:hypothetical protein
MQKKKTVAVPSAVNSDRKFVNYALAALVLRPSIVPPKRRAS